MLAKVFKSGNSQAVRLPKAMRFDVNEVDITKDGDNLILKPVRPNLADAFYAKNDNIGVSFGVDRRHICRLG
jgi:antitoxin VapB